MSNELFIKFIEWIERINQAENISEDLSAFNFGLFQDEENYTIYLIGAKSFDESNDDWAIKEDFVPREKYFKLELENKNWQEAELVVIELLNKFKQTKNFDKSFLANAKYITVGFDDGELTRIK